jgi:hypothetical protein
MRAGLSRTEINALPRLHRQAFLSGLAARVGLIALLGEETAERVWQERDSELRRLLAPFVERSDLPRGSALIKVPDGFRPDVWDVDGRSCTFVPGVGDPESVPLVVHEEVLDHVRYVLIAIHPSYDWGAARGWVTGREFRERAVR